MCGFAGYVNVKELADKDFLEKNLIRHTFI